MVGKGGWSAVPEWRGVCNRIKKKKGSNRKVREERVKNGEKK